MVAPALATDRGGGQLRLVGRAKKTRWLSTTARRRRREQAGPGTGVVVTA